MTKATKNQFEESNDDEKLKKPNEGNGCTLDNYFWEQNLTHVDVTIPLDFPFNVFIDKNYFIIIFFFFKKGDVVFNLTSNHLTVGLKGHEPIIDGILKAPVKSAIWFIIDKKNIGVQLEKVIFQFFYKM